MIVPDVSTAYEYHADLHLGSSNGGEYNGEELKERKVGFLHDYTPAPPRRRPPELE